MLPDAINLDDLVSFRKILHANPSLSNDESSTAELIKKRLAPLKPDSLLTDLGGVGIVAAFDSGKPGPTLMFRCELDALPIQEVNTFAHRSKIDGVSHKCGHDGHMTIICGLAEILSKSRPKKGKVALLFQPAEETGDGGKALMEDKRFLEIAPDQVFAIHNYPEMPLGLVMVRPGATTCGSFGTKIRLIGASSHAAYPHLAISPREALCELLLQLPDIPKNLSSSMVNIVSLTHAALGVPSFGIVPGDATLQVTCRSDAQPNLDAMRKAVHELTQSLCSKHNLKCEITEHEYFPVGYSSEEACKMFIDSANACDLPVKMLEAPIRWSEDFAWYTQKFSGAIVAVGAGENCPQIHAPDYDFPDELLPIVINLFNQIIDSALNN